MTRSASALAVLVASLVAGLGVQLPGSQGAASAAAAAAGAPSPTAVAGAEESTTDTRPSILLISTDNMATTDLRWMPQTRRLLRERGIKLTEFISNHPACCPARAELTTGQYAQNNGVYVNGGAYGGYYALSDRANHLGGWLQAAGYRTAVVGKYLNDWERKAERQPGWTVFDPILRNIYEAYDITMYNNGNPHRFLWAHTSDLVGRRTVRYIKRFAATGQPFFIWASQVAPHNMRIDGRPVYHPIPAKRHRDLYPRAVPPSLQNPAYNEADVSDKPGYVRATSPVSSRRMTTLHRYRIRTLRSVDDQVKAAVDALREVGRLGNTYIFVTSDNGFMMGQHRLIEMAKPYEQSLRVPLVVRGPGIPAGATNRQMWGFVDLAPTFVELAGAVPGRVLDGRSMLAALRGQPSRGYSHYLIQSGNDPKIPVGGEDPRWWWRGVRSHRWVYVRYDGGFEELYDRIGDAPQLRNVARDPAYQEVRDEYAGRLEVLQTCVAEVCRTGGAATP